MLNKDCMVKRQETKNYIATVKTWILENAGIFDQIW